MPHAARVVDEAFVDLWTLTQVDLNIVDMIKGSERGASEDTYRRQNIILAGRDPVATDLVVARLMGYNPDDMEFAVRRGNWKLMFDAEGNPRELYNLDEDRLESDLRAAWREGLRSVAIVFMHGYRHHEHERAAAQHDHRRSERLPRERRAAA